MSAEAQNPIPEITRATPADAAEIHALQRLAYRSEAELYDDWSIPPLVDPLAETERALAGQVVLKAVSAGRIVGAVRGRLAEGTCHVGRLIVHPEAQGRGLGTRLLRALEEAAPEARRYELFTGDRSARNLRLYTKLGYRECRRATLAGRVTLVYLEKSRG